MEAHAVGLLKFSAQANNHLIITDGTRASLRFRELNYLTDDRPVRVVCPPLISYRPVRLPVFILPSQFSSYAPALRIFGQTHAGSDAPETRLPLRFYLGLISAKR